MRLFIDCGASVSLVSRGLVDSLGLSSKIQPCSTVLSSFTKNRIPISGQISLQIEVAGLCVGWKFIVTNILESDYLIGLDFLQKNNIVLDMSRNYLVSPLGKAKFINDPKCVERVLKVKSLKTVTIPPNTVSHMFCCWQNKNLKQGDKYGLFSPTDSIAASHQIFLANSIVYSEKNCIPLQIINPNDEPVTIYRGKILGNLSPVTISEDIRSIRLEQRTFNEKDHPYSNQNMDNQQHEMLPNNEDTMPEWSREDLFHKLNIKDLDIPEDGRNKLKSLLWKYKD